MSNLIEYLFDENLSIVMKIIVHITFDLTFKESFSSWTEKFEWKTIEESKTG